MNFQIVPAATNEIACGRKMSDFAIPAYRTRSARTAMTSPSMSTKLVKKTIHQNTLLRIARWTLLSVRTVA